MIEYEDKIKEIVAVEFRKLISNMENDFLSNYKVKRNNFLLNQLNEVIVANMVFVSSFESKSGNAIEACAEAIARLRYGAENVPAIVNPRGLKHDIKPENISGQVIVTDIDTDNGDLRGFISAFRANNVATGRGKSRIESGVT